LAGEVTVGLVESNGLTTNVSCELTAKKPGSTPYPMLLIEYRRLEEYFTFVLTYFSPVDSISAMMIDLSK